MRTRARDNYRWKYANDPVFLAKEIARVRTRYLNRGSTHEDRSRAVFHYAVKTGKLTKPRMCERCYAEPPPHHLHGHHHDYNRPLDVEWLCRMCHGRAHRKAG